MYRSSERRGVTPGRRSWADRKGWRVPGIALGLLVIGTVGLIGATFMGVIWLGMVAAIPVLISIWIAHRTARHVASVLAASPDHRAVGAPTAWGTFGGLFILMAIAAGVVSTLDAAGMFDFGPNWWLPPAFGVGLGIGGFVLAAVGFRQIRPLRSRDVATPLVRSARRPGWRDRDGF